MHASQRTWRRLVTLSQHSRHVQSDRASAGRFRARVVCMARLTLLRAVASRALTAAAPSRRRAPLSGVPWASPETEVEVSRTASANAARMNSA